MSIKLTQLVWNTELNLTPSEKFVLVFLATCANDRNNYLCCPSLNTIAKRCNLSLRHVKRVTQALCALNVIKKIPQTEEYNNFKSNHYSINEDVLLGGGSDTMSPGVVTPCHQGSDTMSPNNIRDNETIKKENNIKETETSAPEQHLSSVLRSTAKLIIDFLRQKTGRNYRYTETTLKPILQLLKEGVTLEQCKQVIVRKHRDWGSNKEMEKYLRPSTLFRKSNFYDKYLPEVVTEEERKNIMKAI